MKSTFFKYYSSHLIMSVKPLQLTVQQSSQNQILPEYLPSSTRGSPKLYHIVLCKLCDVRFYHVVSWKYYVLCSVLSWHLLFLFSHFVIFSFASLLVVDANIILTSSTRFSFAVILCSFCFLKRLRCKLSVISHSVLFLHSLSICVF